jgi:fructoselysine 6-kinase
MKIAAFSSLCVDHYPQKNIAKPGGNSLNIAVHAKRLGAETVSIAGFIGTDSFADMIEQLLKAEHIDFSHLFRLPGSTASNKIYNTPEGERYSNSGDWDNGVKNAAVLSDATWNFVLSHDIIAVPYWDANLDETIKRRTRKNLVIVDFMHFDDFNIIRNHLQFIDIACMSPKIEHLPDVQRLAIDSKILFIAMLGAEGSKVFFEGKQYFQPALPVPKVIDTTGCGDSYQAGFLHSYFKDRDIPKAMLCGATTALKVLAHYGAVSE